MCWSCTQITKKRPRIVALDQRHQLELADKLEKMSRLAEEILRTEEEKATTEHSNKHACPKMPIQEPQHKRGASGSKGAFTCSASSHSSVVTHKNNNWLQDPPPHSHPHLRVLPQSHLAGSLIRQAPGSSQHPAFARTLNLP